jgi:hypothetical protein
MDFVSVHCYQVDPAGREPVMGAEGLVAGRDVQARSRIVKSSPTRDHHGEAPSHIKTTPPDWLLTEIVGYQAGP